MALSPGWPCWTGSHALIPRVVEECVGSRRILPEMRRAMQAECRAAQIIDVVAVHGTYAMLAIVINTFGPDLDEFAPVPTGYSPDSRVPEPAAGGR